MSLKTDTNTNDLTESYEIIKLIFSDPVRAFDIYNKTDFLSKFHLLKIHFYFWLFVYPTKLIGNYFQTRNIIDFERSTLHPIIDHPLTMLAIYPIFILLVMQMDTIRRFYKPVDRLKSLNYDPPDLFLLAFIPFSASALFWFLPRPWCFIPIAISLLYSVQICYQYLREVSKLSLKEVVMYILFSSVLYLLLLLLLNIGFKIYRNYKL